MCKKLGFLVLTLGFCLSLPASAANIIWVSFHPADNQPGSGAAGAGFTTAADKGYTDLLAENGFTVTRYVQTATPDATLLNAADLVIVSRSVASGSFQDAAATTWNQIKAPMMILGGYVIRQNRMGFSTGNTIPDTTGNITLTVNDPAHPIFAGIPLTGNTMTNPYAGVVNHPTTNALMRGISIVTEAANANGKVLATVSSAGNGPAGAMVIGEWSAGVTVTHAGGAGTDVLGGPRLVFLTGSRETSGVNSETAGYFDLQPDGAKMFINAVRYMTGDTGETATKPQPEDKAVDVPADAGLAWTAGSLAVTHDVYFGTTLADVTDASRTDPRGVLVSKGQATTTYVPADRLEYGEVYYWRVDEVGAAPDFKIFKGAVWSFTAEPVSYPIANVMATASSFSAGMGPENTVNGSGLNSDDQHSADAEEMWLSEGTGPQPTWIQYEFDRLYKLDRLLVWNYNQTLESILGFGAKDVTVSYSADGEVWTPLGDSQFAQASGAVTYTPGVTVDFGGATAKFVKLTIANNWGGLVAQYGLSEVRFLYRPVAPREPIPADAQTSVEVDAALTWRAGREAASHNVYFGTDPNALALAATISASRYTPAALDLGTTYYWKVVEVNDAETPNAWEGDVWSFTTKEYSVVDDLESYTDEEGSRIFDSWLDGWDVDENGSQVGHAESPFAEKSIIHGGKQAMPLYYDNTAPVNYSEAELTWTSTQDWTLNGADTLSLYFRGQPTGFQELAADHIMMNGIGTDIFSTADQGRFVYKQFSGNGTIIARVDRLDATDPWAKAGVMIRQSLEANSIWALALYAPGNGFRFQTRPITGGAGASDTAVVTPAQAAARAPVWIKLERTGDQFNAYYATVEAPTTWIGSPWNPQTITMTGPVYIGLAVTSHVATAVTQAEFSSIAITGAATGTWQSVDLGVEQPAGNTPDTLYVTVKDSTGKSVTLKHADALAATLSTWQQWQIPFSSLTGINPARVKTLILGVGDRTAPQHGSGTLYIDDIAVGHPLQ